MHKKQKIGFLKWLQMICFCSFFYTCLEAQSLKIVVSENDCVNCNFWTFNFLEKLPKTIGISLQIVGNDTAQLKEMLSNHFGQTIPANFKISTEVDISKISKTTFFLKEGIDFKALDFNTISKKKAIKLETALELDSMASFSGSRNDMHAFGDSLLVHNYNSNALFALSLEQKTASRQTFPAQLYESFVVGLLDSAQVKHSKAILNSIKFNLAYFESTLELGAEKYTLWKVNYAAKNNQGGIISNFHALLDSKNHIYRLPEYYINADFDFCQAKRIVIQNENSDESFLADYKLENGLLKVSPIQSLGVVKGGTILQNEAFYNKKQSSYVVSFLSKTPQKLAISGKHTLKATQQNGVPITYTVVDNALIFHQYVNDFQHTISIKCTWNQSIKVSDFLIHKGFLYLLSDKGILYTAHVFK